MQKISSCYPKSLKQRSVLNITPRWETMETHSKWNGKPLASSHSIIKKNIWGHQGRVTNDVSSGWILDTYWELLEKEIKPKSKPFECQGVKHGNQQPKSTLANPSKTCYRCKLHTQKVMRKYAKPSKPSVAIARKLVTMKNAAWRLVTFQRSKNTSQCSSHSQLRPQLLQQQVLKHKPHRNTGMRPHVVSTFPERSYLVQHWQGNQLCQLQSHSKDRHWSRHECSEQE